MSVLELAVDSVVGSVAVTCSAGLMGVVEATTITVTVPFRESFSSPTSGLRLYHSVCHTHLSPHFVFSAKLVDQKAS